MVFHEQPTDPWTDADFRLLEAYQILQDETCGNCGHPIWLCRSNEVLWAVRSATCQAERTVAEWRDGRTDKDGKSTVKEGTHPYSVPFVHTFDDSGNPVEDYDNLPSRRSFFQSDDVE